MTETRELFGPPTHTLSDADHRRWWTRGWRESLAHNCVSNGDWSGHIADEPTRFSAAKRAWHHGWNSAVKHGAEWLLTHEAATESGSDAYGEYSPRGRALRREG